MGCTIDASDRELRKSGIFTESQETAIAEDGDSFRELQVEIDDLRSVQPNLIEEDLDATTFADVDAEVIAVQTPPSDAEIVAELLEREGTNDDDHYYSGDKGDTIQSYTSRIESKVDQQFAKNKQASIRDFLNKN